MQWNDDVQGYVPGRQKRVAHRPSDPRPSQINNTDKKQQNGEAKEKKDSLKGASSDEDNQSKARKEQERGKKGGSEQQQRKPAKKKQKKPTLPPTKTIIANVRGENLPMKVPRKYNQKWSLQQRTLPKTVLSRLRWPEKNGGRLGQRCYRRRLTSPSDSDEEEEQRLQRIGSRPSTID